MHLATSHLQKEDLQKPTSNSLALYGYVHLASSIQFSHLDCTLDQVSYVLGLHGGAFLAGIAHYHIDNLANAYVAFCSPLHENSVLVQKDFLGSPG